MFPVLFVQTLNLWRLNEPPPPEDAFGQAVHATEAALNLVWVPRFHARNSISLYIKSNNNVMEKILLGWKKERGLSGRGRSLRRRTSGSDDSNNPFTSWCSIKEIWTPSLKDFNDFYGRLKIEQKSGICGPYHTMTHDLLCGVKPSSCCNPEPLSVWTYNAKVIHLY